MLKSIVKQGKTSESKIEKLKQRQLRVEGDCLIVAATIAYLSILPINERIKARSELSEHLLLRLNMEASDCWNNT